MKTPVAGFMEIFLEKDSYGDTHQELNCKSKNCKNIPKCNSGKFLKKLSNIF